MTILWQIFGANMTGEHLCRYSGAGDELISPVYIAPTLPPYVERTWPEEEVKIFDDDQQF